MENIRAAKSQIFHIHHRDRGKAIWRIGEYQEGRAELPVEVAAVEEVILIEEYGKERAGPAWGGFCLLRERHNGGGPRRRIVPVILHRVKRIIVHLF